MSEQLKPCPFCGNEEVEWQESHVGFSIECYKCEYHTGGDLTLNAVTKQWNTRAESEQVTQLQQENAALKKANAELREFLESIQQMWAMRLD